MKHMPKDTMTVAEAISNAAFLSIGDTGNTSLSWKIHTETADILALEAAWRSLETASHDPLLFQSFDWCRSYVQFRLKVTPASGSFRPVVVSLHSGDTVIAILPLAIQGNAGLKVLTGFTEPFQQYTEIVMRPDFMHTETGAMLRAALENTGADYVHLGQVRQNGTLATLLEGVATPSGEREAAPYVEISSYPDHATYEKTIRSKTRKNLRNARNRLEREAAVTHQITRSGPAMQKVVDRVFEGRAAWLERMGITSRAFSDSDFQAFLDHMSGDGANGVDTIAMSLTHGDKAMSDQWGFVFKGRYYAFMATWNPEYEASSPGRLHLGEVVRTCFDEGFKVADFMLPAVDYKMTWTDKVAPVRDYVLPLSLKGHIYCRCWLDFARPLAKRLFFSFPARLRTTLLKTLVNRKG